MKKLFTVLITLAMIFAFVGCKQPVDDSPKLPKLTIRNQSSFGLIDVKFSGISFAVSSSNDLPTSTQISKELMQVQVNQAGYITFIRKDIGIPLRITQPVTVGKEDHSITILDSTVVEEVGGNNNTGTLSAISFVSGVGIEYNSLNVAKNDVVNLGEAAIDIVRQYNFMIKNTGVGKLLFTGNAPVKITGDTEMFSIVQPSSSEIIFEGSLPFKINFAPKAEQTYTATVTVQSNAKDGDFIFTINAKGVPPRPIASVFYGNTEIPQNGTIVVEDEVLISQSKNITITIKNTGEEVLTIDTANIDISGANALAFTKVSPPGGNISPGNQSSFLIEYKPVTQGENNATLTIPTNDTFRNPVTIFLQGTAVKGAAVMELNQAATKIENNMFTSFDFGRVEMGTSKSLIFTIKNTGNIALNLTGTPVIVSSNEAFVVPSQPTNTTINPEASIQFLVQYTPTEEEKVDTATLTIPNDSNESVFALNIKGTGYVKKPQIQIMQGNTVINPFDEYDFGIVGTEETKEITFTIVNAGEAALSFTTVKENRVNLEDNEAEIFTVTWQPTVTTIVTPGNTTTFAIKFAPEIRGIFSALILITTNSQYDGEFAFRIKGTGEQNSYKIGETGPAGGIVFYDKGVFTNGWRYLEASPVETELSAQWGAYGYDITGTKEGVGTGKENTRIIVAYLATIGETGRAAQIRDIIGYNGFTDWFLPSKNELDLIHDNLAVKGLGGVKSGLYWSSSQFNTSYAWYQSFNTGSQDYANKSNSYHVRVIRSF